MLAEYEAVALSGLIFVLAGLMGTCFAYLRRWAFSDDTVPLKAYFFADGKAIARALTTLGIACAAIGGFQYFEVMTPGQVIVAGIGVGIMIPERVESALLEKERVVPFREQLAAKQKLQKEKTDASVGKA